MAFLFHFCLAQVIPFGGSSRLCTCSIPFLPSSRCRPLGRLRDRSYHSCLQMAITLQQSNPPPVIASNMQPTPQLEHPINSFTPRSSYHSRPPQPPPRPPPVRHSMLSSQAPSLPPQHPQQIQSSVYRMGSSAMRASNIQQKRDSLKRYKYINQLARLEFEEKAEEIHTKYTRVSRASVMKKMKARNMIAQFEEEEAEEEVGMEELLEFKYGKDKTEGVYFEKEQMQEYCFCGECDSIHNDHPEAHAQICQKIRAQDPQLYSPYSPNYHIHSLLRLQQQVGKIKDHQYQELHAVLSKINSNISDPQRQKCIQDLCWIQEQCQGDAILAPLIGKVMGLAQSNQHRQ